MKIDELMIGDWVYSHGKFCDDKRRICKEDFSKDFNPDPIPLTQEILEKNGFNRLVQTGVVEPYYWFFFDKETEVKIKAFNTIYRGLWVECVNPVNNAITHKQCEFVHELQHALKICEIKKEIVIHNL